MSVDQERWWYDAPRAVFIRGVYPLVEESISEELVRDLVGHPPPADTQLPVWLERLRGLARHLAEVRKRSEGRDG